MLLEPEQLKEAAELHPTVAEFVQKNPTPPAPWEHAEAVASLMQSAAAATLVKLGPAEPSLSEEYKQIPMRDGYESTIKIHKQVNSPGGPVVVLFFGGAFIAGDKDQMTPVARAFVRLFGAVAVTVDYRLAPKYKFPTGQNDAWDTTKWIAAHASELGADPSKGFIVGGVSAGGCQAAMVTNLSIEENLQPRITGQWLANPTVMEEEHVPEKYKKYFLSREHNKGVPIPSLPTMELLAKHTGWKQDSPLRFPILFHTTGRVPASKLPPTFTMACGSDPVRDDGLIYDEILKENGVKTKVEFYPGAPHAHWGYVPGIELSHRALVDMTVGIGWLLGKEVKREDGLQALAGATNMVG